MHAYFSLFSTLYLLNDSLVRGAISADSTVISCPEKNGDYIILPTGKPIEIAISNPNEICFISRVDNQIQLIPVGRSYDGFDWETVAGPYQTLSFDCKSNICKVEIPTPLYDNQSFHLTKRVSKFGPNKINEAARFLEQTTFGTTKPDLDELKKVLESKKKFAIWTKRQMYNISPTLHRAYWRQRVSSRMRNDTFEARINHPCGALSRWRRFAFTKNDLLSNVLVRKMNDGYLELSIRGEVRTYVTWIQFVSSSAVFSYHEPALYQICDFASLYEGMNVKVSIMWNGNCERIVGGNPPVMLRPNTDSSYFEIDVSDQSSIFIKQYGNDDYLISSKIIQDEICDLIPTTGVENKITAIFIKLSSNLYYIHDPHLTLESNDLNQPLHDGGGDTVVSTKSVTKCANTPMTFLNENDCKVSYSTNACSKETQSLDVFYLGVKGVQMIYESSGRYVYAIDDLRVEDDDLVNTPCTPNIRTRWRRAFDKDENCVVNVQPKTHLLFTKMIQKSSDSNIMIKDLYLSDDMECHGLDMETRKVTISVDGQCWESSHPDHMNVYDFTYWTEPNTHPGNTEDNNPIKKFANEGSIKLLFPKSHTMERWHQYKKEFPWIGRFGDQVDFQSLPDNLKMPSVSMALNLQTVYDSLGPGAVVCGSPGESANDYLTFHSFTFAADKDELTIPQSALIQQRQTVWYNIALRSPDQLRQRMAWALSQILVISEDISVNTEIYLGYYDIFVRNAFGNYRDILKEVAYSPLMADMLSYYRSKSTEIVWRDSRQVQYADENFAREIMQLFSVGLLKLNMDGTLTLNQIGKTIHVYENEDIMEYARVWTGFTRQYPRGNYEELADYLNSIDPMMINIEWRDHYPKMVMDGKYVGDGYMLCSDLPSRMFLKKGAKFRLLGKSKFAELQSHFLRKKDDISNVEVPKISSSSNLYAKLCDAGWKSQCRYPSTVILDQSLDCVSVECELETIQVIEVGDGIYYEYVQLPCVHFSYFADGKKIKSDITKGRDCVSRKSVVAAELCCDSDGQASRETCMYTSELVSFDIASSRCKSMNKDVCGVDSIRAESCIGKCCNMIGNFWSKANCNQVLVVRFDGKVAIEPHTSPEQDYHALTYFRVHWEDDYPSAITNECGGNLCKTIGSYCRCQIDIQDKPVFADVPSSYEVLTSLAVGGAPDYIRSYKSSKLAKGVKVHFHQALNVYDIDTVFEVTDDFGRILHLKNLKSTVVIVWQGGTLSKFKFRNPPQFFASASPQLRDAHHETDAAIDHVFYHKNTAPFLAYRFIQRFGISNPSPRYINQVAKSFKSGVYVDVTTGFSFGSGEYGDLGATIASLILDREARNVLLDMDPTFGSLREPTIKVMAAMRNFHYYYDQDNHLELYDMKEKIGQMPHGIPSVFSFFLPEHSPPGVLAQASLVSPEAMVLNYSLGLINGLTSLVKYGLSGCNGGFGYGKSCTNLNNKVSFTPEADNDQNTIVDEIATLLTSGRMSSGNRKIISDMMSLETDQNTALLLAQQLALTSPEFHATGLVEKSKVSRTETAPKTAPQKPYKAVIHLLLQGGADSYNMLIPHSECKGNDLFQQYNDIRGSLALDRGTLLTIDASGSNQPCSTFGLHPKLKVIQNLYEQKDAIFFANVGVLTEPVTKKNYAFKMLTQLFAHNDMQKEIGKLDPFHVVKGTGSLGRTIDVLSLNGYKVNSFSVDTTLLSLAGVTSNSTKVTIESKAGFQMFNVDPTSDGMLSAFQKMNDKGDLYSNMYAETWSDFFIKAMNENDELYWAQESSNLSVTFPDNKVGQQLKRISQMIQSNKCRGSERDVFYLEVGPYDHHDSMVSNLDLKLTELNSALNAFVIEMKNQNRWDDVTLVATSDFGRTLTPNSGEGSDHGWSGHSFILGGGLDGGKILGEYPDDLSENSSLNIGRGRLLPTMPWEAIWSAVIEWFGVVDEEDLDTVLPNRKSFPSNSLFTANQLYTGKQNTAELAGSKTNIYVSCLQSSSIQPTSNPTSSIFDSSVNPPSVVHPPTNLSYTAVDLLGDTPSRVNPTSAASSNFSTNVGIICIKFGFIPIDLIVPFSGLISLGFMIW